MTLTADIATEFAAERRRQVVVRGYSEKHDDEVNAHGQLAEAASCYIRATSERSWSSTWPWRREAFKPGANTIEGKRRDLVKAGALLIAEIQRLDRMAQQAQPVERRTSRPASTGAGGELKRPRCIHCGQTEHGHGSAWCGVFVPADPAPAAAATGVTGIEGARNLGAADRQEDMLDAYSGSAGRRIEGDIVNVESPTITSPPPKASTTEAYTMKTIETAFRGWMTMVPQINADAAWEEFRCSLRARRLA